ATCPKNRFARNVGGLMTASGTKLPLAALRQSRQILRVEQTCHPTETSTAKFAVMHNAVFPTKVWYGAILGLRAAHYAAQVHHASRRCCGVAACGAGAAAGKTGRRISSLCIARHIGAPRVGGPRGPPRSRLRGG